MRWTPARLTVLLLLTLLSSFGCGGEPAMKYGPPSDGVNGSFQGCRGGACGDEADSSVEDSDPERFTPCADGEVRACLVVLGEHEGVKSCFAGVQMCFEGAFGPCVEGGVS